MKLRLMSLLASAAVLFATAATQAREIDELVVSVRKTDENIQQVPIQVTSIGEDIVRSENVNDIAKVAELTPSLQFDQGFWVQDTRVSIRGLFNRAGRPSAAILIDGIDASGEAFESTGGSALVNQRLLDVERIEVARGPQSALYGRAAFAGAINYVTRRPPEEFEVTFDGQLAEGGRGELNASVGGTLIENTLTAKLYGSHYEQDGDYTNPNTGGDLGSGDSDGIGLAFEWTPSDEFSAYWNTTYTEDEYTPQAVAFVAANEFIRLANDGTELGTLTRNANPADCNSGAGDACLWAVTGTIDAGEGQIDISPDPRTGRDFAGNAEKTLRSNLILEWSISDGLDFRSATSYMDSRQSINFDSTQTFRVPGAANTYGTRSGNYADARNFFEYQQFFQEFQLSGDAGDNGSNWLLGINAYIEDASDLNRSRFWYRDQASSFCSNPFLPAPCSFAAADQFDKTLDRDTRSYSIFGLYTWRFAEQWDLTLEGRLIRDEVDIKSSTADLGADALGNFAGGFVYNNSPGVSDSVSDTNFLPRVTLNYFYSDDTLIYASIAKGIKPPTFNTTDYVGTNPATGVNANAVGKEELWSYEIGTKNTFYDGKLLLNGAIYYNDYTDQQVRVQFPRPVPPGGIPTSGAVNAGEVTVWGLEVDSSWLPTDRWLVNVSYAYTNGEYDDFVLAEAQATTGQALSRSEQAKAGNLLADVSGNETPGVPEHAATLLARYTAPLVNNMEWFGQASVSWQGERWADKSNLVKLDSYTLANVQLGVQEEAWSVAVFLDNAFDDDTVRYAQEFIDQGQGFQFTTSTYPVGYFAYLPQPRTLGIRFSYRTP